MKRNKFTPFILGAVAIAIVLLVVLIQSNSKKDVPSQYPPQASSDTSASKGTSATATIKTVSTKSGQYTLAEVATHNSRSDCWTTINGGVYDVTSWISQHPGGEDKILGLCGIDGSAMFNTQHGGQGDPAAELATLKVGTLKQ